MLTAPWSITGRITDSLGNPVVDADVTISGSDCEQPYGLVKRDAAGRYPLNSSRPHFASQYVVARKPGFETMRELQVPCCGTAASITLVRIVRITPTAPTSLRVGEAVEMPASVVVFDSGETRNIFVLPTSSASGVIDVRRSSHWYEMRAMSEGVATLTFDLWGAVATTSASASALTTAAQNYFFVSFIQTSSCGGAGTFPDSMRSGKVSRRLRAVKNTGVPEGVPRPSVESKLAEGDDSYRRGGGSGPPGHFLGPGANAARHQLRARIGVTKIARRTTSRSSALWLNATHADLGILRRTRDDLQGRVRRAGP